MNKNFTSDKIKHVLVENESNELSKKVKGISAERLKKYLIDKFNIANGPKYFSSGIFQNYLVFVPGKTYIKNFSGSTRIDSWKSNGVSEEKIENIIKSGSNFATTFVDHNLLPDINFNGHCLIKK